MAEGFSSGCSQRLLGVGCRGVRCLLSFCGFSFPRTPSSLKHILAPDLLQTVRRPWDTVSAAWVIPGHFLLRRSGLVLTLGHINFASKACAVHTLS